MDAQRLLGMLNGPPATATPSSPSPAQHPTQVSSPPATLQSLLSQLQSPQITSPRDAPPHMMSPPISDSGNAAELFRSAGMLPSIPPPPSSQLGVLPGPSHHRVLSPGAGNAQSLLATLMSGSNPGSNMPSPGPGLPFGLTKPVIDHQGPSASEIPLPMSPAPPAPNGNRPASSQLQRVSTNQSSRSVQQQQPEQPQQVLQEKETEQAAEDMPQEDVHLASPQVEGNASKENAPSASKFTFVSPFDVFDLPTPAQSSVKKESAATPSAKSPMSSKANTPKVSKQLPKQVASPSKSKSNPAVPAAQPAPRNAPPPQTQPLQRVDSAQAPKKAEMPHTPYPVTAKAGQLARVVPIKNMQYTFDLSDTTTNSVGHIAEQFKEEIASVKTNAASGMQRGNKIATSKTFVSYALAKGKVRIIDYTSGVNTAVVLEGQTGSSARVVDIAVSEDWLAALGEDGSLGLWKLQAESNAETLTAVNKWMTGPSRETAKSLSWVQVHGQSDQLIITTESEAFAITPGQLVAAFARGNRDWLDVVDVISHGRHVNVVDVATKLQDIECAVLYRDNNVQLVNVNSDLTKDCGIHAPSQGGSWRSILQSGSFWILCSDRNEYAVFPLTRHKAPSVFFLQDPSGTLDVSTITTSTAVLDCERNILWIAIWSRQTLLAVKISGTAQPVFSAYAEFATGPISDLAVDLSSTNKDASIIYRHPKGFSMFTLSRSTRQELDEISAPQPEEPSEFGSEIESDKIEQAIEVAQEEAASAQEEVETTPASPVVREAPVAQDVTVNLPKSVTSPVQTNAAVATPAADIDYTKIENIITSAVSKSVDTELRKVIAQQGDIHASIQSAFERQGASIDNTLGRIVTETVQRELSGTLPRIVKEEVASGVLPLLDGILREEVEKHVGDKLANAILFSVETTVMGQVEKALVPHLGRTFTSILSPAVDKSVRTLIDEKLLPQFVAAVDHVPVEVSRAIHQEMLDVRKDVMIEQSSQATASDAAMLSMSKSLAALSEQVQSLTREIETLRMTSQSAAAMPPQGASGPPTGQMLHMVPHMGGYNGGPGNNNMISMSQPPLPPPQVQQQQQQIPQQNQIISPQPVLAPNAGALQQLISGTEDAEDVFLKAFSSLSEGDLVQFVMSRRPRTGEYLPDPRERPSPLSQAVLLTMVHRLSKCLEGHSTESQEYQAVMTWIYRASSLINPRDDTIQSYLPAVRKTLEDTFRNAMDHFTRSRDNSNASRSAGQMMLKIISILNRPHA